MRLLPLVGEVSRGSTARGVSDEDKGELRSGWSRAEEADEGDEDEGSSVAEGDANDVAVGIASFTCAGGWGELAAFEGEGSTLIGFGLGPFGESSFSASIFCSTYATAAVGFLASSFSIDGCAGCGGCCLGGALDF